VRERNSLISGQYSSSQGICGANTTLALEFPCKIKPMRAVEQRKPAFGTTNRAGFHFLAYFQALAISHCLSRAKLRQVEVLAAQGKAVAEAVRAIGATEQLRDELLDGEVFSTLREAQVLIEQWRQHYCLASQHPSGYVVENGRASWPDGGPAGWFGFFRA
jgi:hypothetical protein